MTADSKVPARRNYERLDRVLWLITGGASLPLGLLFLLKLSQVELVLAILLGLPVIIFNAVIVPVYVFRGTATFTKQVLTIGLNIIFAILWIRLTGGAASSFYPHIFIWPLLAAAVFGGFGESLVTAGVVTVVTLAIHLVDGIPGSPVSRSLLVELNTFWVVAVTVGYLVAVEKEQRRRNQGITRELQLAYGDLSQTHQQLQSYTEIIEQLKRKMEKLAITDELTQLYNYRYFLQVLDGLMANQLNRPLALLMLDLDWFKKVNDYYGHQVGNQILIEVASIIKLHVRLEDVVARYGGEEFAVILPDAEQVHAQQAAERLRLAIANHRFDDQQGEGIKITVSIGIASYLGDAHNQSELISHADLALYQAKQDGRNCVRLYSRQTKGN